MLKIAWVTDPHMESVDEESLTSFWKSIVRQQNDAVFITGDISTNRYIEEHLGLIDSILKIPIYFVLGNHDAYGSSLGDARIKISRLVAQSRFLHWVTEEGIIELTDKTCLIGHDGWYDGRNGDYWHSNVILTDFTLLREFKWQNRDIRLETMRRLADEGVSHFRRYLTKALIKYNHVIIMTHVPPFREVAYHDGEPSDEYSLPFFTCQAAGELFLKVMRKNPDKRLTVLCGHTHSRREYSPIPNINVLCGRAEYGKLYAEGIGLTSAEEHKAK